MVARNQVQNCMLEMLRFFTLHVLQYAVGIGLAGSTYLKVYMTVHIQHRAGAECN